MANSRTKSQLRTSPMVGCLKAMLVLFNFLFLVTGIAILVLGVWTKVELYKYMEITTDYRPEIPIVLIVTGCGILLFGCLGCICIFKPKPCFLYMYAVFLFLIFIVELSAGIAGLVYKNKLEAGFKEGLEKHLKEYNNDNKEAVDGVQKSLHCCGSSSYEDWYNTTWAVKQHKKIVPDSCCKVPVANCVREGTDNTTLTIYTEGCYKKVTDFTADNIGAIDGSVIGFSFIQLFGAMFSYLLGKAIAKQTYEQVA